MDGTLLRDDGSICSIADTIIKKHRLLDNEIIITTARSRNKVLDLCKELNGSDYIISSNGAEIYDIRNSIIIESNCIDKKNIFSILSIAIKYELELDLSVSDQEYNISDF